MIYKDIKMHIFVINLNKRPERFKNALKNLRSVGLNDFIIRKEACTPERAMEEYTKYISMSAYNNITSNVQMKLPAAVVFGALLKKCRINF